MKSALREGDFKLYKRYFTDDFELYRLYENGQRLDLEEKNDLAKDPAYASVVARLSATLDAELAANNAELPYLNPAYADHDKESAKIAKEKFDSTKRLAQISIESGGPGIAEAYVIYQSGVAKSKTKKKKTDADSGMDKKEQRREARRLERRNKANGDSSGGDSQTASVPEAVGGHGSAINGMKQPVTIAANGQSVSVEIPAEVKAYRFILIDSNRFLQYGDMQLAK